MAATYSLSVTPACLSGAGTGILYYTCGYAPSGGGPGTNELPSSVYLLSSVGVVLGQQASGRGQSGNFGNLPDGAYFLRWVEDDSQAELATKDATLSCGGAAPLTLEALTGVNPSSGSSSDGSLQGLARGGTAPLTAQLLPAGPTQPITAGQAFTFPGLPAGTYPVRVLDAAGAQVQATETLYAPAALGCTDPRALNPTAGATVEDGSCMYAPPVVEPTFSVPLLQSLRFVVPDALPETPDNTLFCQQARPGQQQRPLYYQLVEFGDGPLRVQVLSNYAAVSATIYHHGGAAAGPAVPLTIVRRLEGNAPPLAVVLSADPTGLTRLKAAAGGALPASLLGAARLTLAGGTSGTYRVTQAVAGSIVTLDDYLVLNRPWTAPIGAVTATWLLRGPGFNVWEAEVPVAGLAGGYYQVVLTATQAGWPAASATSEPLHLLAHHANTVPVDFGNADNSFGLVFSTGIRPRLRVRATFFRGKNGGTESLYTDSAGDQTLLASTATRLRTLEVYGQPDWLHEKLYLACRLGYLVVNGVRMVSPAAYEKSEERTYPLTGGHVDLQQLAWLGAGNGDDFGLDENVPDNALALRGGGYLLLRGR